MTTYILHGGNIRGSADEGKAYYEEIVKDLSDQPRLLICLFALPREEWEREYAEETEHIARLLKSRQPVFTMADPVQYAKQAARADALIIAGGDNELCMHWAQRADGFMAALQTLPVVAGSSAGADSLTETFWPYDWRVPYRGLGVLAQNAIVHYGAGIGEDDPRGPVNWEQAEAALRAVIGPAAPLLKLAEGEHVVVKK